MKTFASIRLHFQHPRPYVLWTAVSSLLLAGAREYDPHVFGATAFGAAAVSAFLLVIAAFVAPRRIPLAIAGAAPTAVSFAVLSTYNWA